MGLKLELREQSYPWQMRVVLAYLRDECALTFDAAWSRALMALPRPAPGTPAHAEREEWGRILQSHRDVWRDAYTRLPGVPLLEQADVEQELADLVERARALAA